MDDIFLAYGVRGIAGKTLTGDTVKKIAWVFGKMNPGTILLSHDCRTSSAEFYRCAYSGLAAAGADVLPGGLATTPMAIFGINHHRIDGGLAVTASHNPPEWNGLKFYRASGEPIGMENGLERIREESLSAPTIPSRDPSPPIPLVEEYEAFLTRSFEPLLEQAARSLTIVIDNGNGAVSPMLDRILGHLPWIEPVKLFWEPDGNFPGRGPNPLVEGALEPLARTVRERHADFGVAFDADGDRIFFVDEKGGIVRADWILAWLIDEYLTRAPAEKIVLPIGSPRIAEDVIRDRGGTLVVSKVGFVAMRADMRREQAIFGGERSGHYYFRDFFFADSGLWTMLTVLRFFLGRRAPLSEIVSPYRKYATTGEVNVEVRDRAATLERIRRTYRPLAKRLDERDGFFADFGNWWMLARPSNTEPLIRIVVEGEDEHVVEQNRKAVVALIGRE